MTLPNVDLQTFPRELELRDGTDATERALQLAYHQASAALLVIDGIEQSGLFPERVVNAAKEAEFTTAIGNLKTELTSAISYYKEIMAMVP